MLAGVEVVVYMADAGRQVQPSGMKLKVDVVEHNLWSESLREPDRSQGGR